MAAGGFTLVDAESTCTVYRYTSDANGVGNMFVLNGEVSWQYGSNQATPWHGSFEVLPSGWLQIRFNCRGNLKKIKVTTLMPAGNDTWFGRDSQTACITLEKTGEYYLAGDKWIVRKD